MGRYRSSSSDEEDRSKKSKKRKKRRSRSSSISSQQSRISDTKGKRSRRKQRRSSRSRSQSLDRKGSRLSRRSRSRSPDRYGNRKPRSRSRLSDRRGSRRSRSPASRYGRSRSPSSRRPRSYSRSVSQERKRNSRSYSRERSSHNVDRDYTHRSSTDKHRSAVQGSPKLKGQPILESAPELNEMTPFEQAEDRMRQALKAAEAAGEKLKCFSGQESTDSKNFMTSVAAIESDSFLASSFRSSRSARIKEEADSGLSHDDAIFGSLAISGFILTPDPDIKPVQLDSDSIMHPSLYCDLQEKMDRWISRLSQLRRRKLEGEAMQ